MTREPIEQEAMQAVTDLKEHTKASEAALKGKWPDPTPEMLERADFNAIWDVIKKWDINVPHAYQGYCGATGNHVRAILDGLNTAELERYKGALQRRLDEIKRLETFMDFIQSHARMAARHGNDTGRLAALDNIVSTIDRCNKGGAL